MTASFIDKIKIAFREPKRIVVYLLGIIAPIIPDRLYLRMLFRAQMGYKLNLDNPQTFSEKLQWLKLYNRKPEYTQMVDKYEAKKYVAGIIGEEYIIPTLGVWDSVDDIDFDALPNQFVLKTTHGGGNTGVVICRDKSTLDIPKAKAKLKKSLGKCIYRQFREWPYKNVKRRIIAETYIEDIGDADLTDYKFYCFDNTPLYCQVIKSRNSKETIDFFDAQWRHQSFCGLNPIAKNSKNPIRKPLQYELMIDIATKLSYGIPFARVDLYNVKGDVFFGEITLFPASGMGCFRPEEWNYTLGKWIKLPNEL